MHRKINVTGPSITSKEIDYVTEAVRNAWYDNAYTYNLEFEEKFANYIGRKYALSLPSCTSALHLSLVSLGIGEGDEVIVPDITWVATISPLQYVGAKPVFVDINKDTWCIEESKIEENITPKTKAIIPVDLYGSMPDYDKILKICCKYNLFLIEDSAQALGSSYTTKKAGSFGDISVFSFHGTKILTTGEGGMLLTDSKEIYDKCKMLSSLGRKPESDKMFWMDEIAYKYKMSSLQAALGSAQLDRIDELIDLKTRIFSWYKEEISQLPGINMNYVPEKYISNYWMTTIVWDKDYYNIEKEQLMEALLKQGIQTRPFFYPLSMIPATKEYTNGIDYINKNTVAYSLSPYSINLPCGGDMNKEKVQYVCHQLKKILTNHKH